MYKIMYKVLMWAGVRSYNTPMIQKRPPTTNASKLLLAKESLQALLDQATRPGFHGSVSIEVAVQDGILQHVRKRLERLER